MKQHISIWAILMAVLALSGCGKSLLTAEQKAQVADTLQSMGRAQLAARDAQAGAAGGAAAPTPGAVRIASDRSLAMRWAASLAYSGTAGTSQDETAVSMGQKLKDAKCDVAVSDASASAGNSSSIPSLNMQVSGAKCPASLKLSLSVTGTSSTNDLKGTFACQYSVQDPAYAALNDIDSMDVQGGFDMTGSSGGFDMKIDIEGKVHSQKKGDVKIALTGKVGAQMSGSGGAPRSSGDVVLKLTYPDFTATLEEEIKNDGTIKYFINDEEVSAPDFAEYYSKLGVSSGSGGLPTI